jgi:1-acyl-sn-glycerol-3-phosphate acyltransferase
MPAGIIFSNGAALALVSADSYDGATCSGEVMRRLLTGSTVSLLLLLNTLILIGPLLLIALLRLVLPGARLRDACAQAVMWVAETWAEIDKLIFAALTPTRWDIRGGQDLRRDRSYLVISNHQSWVDIPALVQAFNRKAPYFKFFLKQQLIWVPFLGLAFWALDYPFMKRYSKAFLERNPHLRGKDLEITRAACERFRDMPVTVVNYLEGTRCTPAKQAAQASPYRYLLKPKAGGVAFVLAALGEQLDAILDVTVVYPGARPPGFWKLISGQVADVIVDIQTRELDAQLWLGDYLNDPQQRQRMQDWVSQLWLEKDERIARLKREIDSPRH